MKIAIILLAGLCAIQTLTIAQEPLLGADAKEEYQKHYDQSTVHIAAGQYAEGMNALKMAAAIARENNLQEAYLRASVDLAETMRKSELFNEGLQVLISLGPNPEYPLQEVRRLGRIAAIYHQSYGKSQQQYDSVYKYVTAAMAITRVNNFDLELASLKNELGYLLSAYKGWQSGINYHEEAAELFYAHNDIPNYLGAMTKATALMVKNTSDYQKIDSLFLVMLSELDKLGWHEADTELSGLISLYEEKRGNLLESSRWHARSLRSQLKKQASIYSDQMNNFKVLYETDQIQAEAEITEQALQEQRRRNRSLAIYISILGTLIIAIGILFYRERMTKRALNKVNGALSQANERYQMLMIESNHRIKNNLQMIISMLEYAGKDLNPENTKAIKRMSGKIHTISALHKHLYVDVHNARVDLATYFQEVITLYTDLSNQHLQVHQQLEPASIESERLVYFGLILNEMLSNTLEHHKADHKEVYISTSRHGEAYHFEYRDDSEHAEGTKQGTGTLLIRQLINRIGGQNLEFDPRIGQYKFQFYA